ncbi:hypothetical protein KHQ88_03110 [Mycoplasmatota bacterium]|nr:hypothetical protein KHQ88_03110 [Mycoplasmatota bacterium]
MYHVVKRELFDSILIENEFIKVELINYGATIKQIQTKNYKGEFEDILLEYKNDEDYINNSIFLNATIGPIAGRVRNGELITENHHYNLDKNQDGKHTLHSSNLALSYKNFNYDINYDNHQHEVVFTYVEDSLSNLQYEVKVIYTILENQIKINFQVETHNDFFFNLTNHAYFNLSGNLKSDIKNHIVNIQTKKFHQLDKDLISTHTLLENQLFDFTKSKALDKCLEKLKNTPNQGYDDIFYFDKDINDNAKASMYDPSSKRLLEIFSTYDHMVFYTHNNISDQPLKHLNDHKMHYGVCFEFQKSPHLFSYNNASKTYLSKTQAYNEEIIFKFSLKK